MATLKDNEEFLRAFEEPTRIYTYLHMRSVYSPIFLPRNLSYMRARKCESKRKQAPFDWDKWRDTITARNDSAATRNTSLVLHFQGYADEKNAQVDTVDIDIYLAQGRNNNNNIDKNKHMLRTITVDANRSITSPQPITITRDELLQCGTAADKSCAILMEISYMVVKEGGSNGGRGRPRAAKRLQICYDTYLNVFDERGYSSLRDGAYELHMKGNRAATPVLQFDPQDSGQALLDYVAGNGKSAKGSPSLKFLLKWTADEHPPKPKSASISPNQMDNRSVDEWCESIGNGIKRKFQPKHRHTYSSDDSISTGTTKSGDDGEYGAHGGNIESSTASTSSLSMSSGVSSDMGSDDNEMLTITTKKSQTGHTVLSGLTNLEEYGDARLTAIGIINFGRRITYTFKYNGGSGGQAEKWYGFICPWCLLNCGRLHPLLMHLRLCHDRFQFDYEVKPSGTHIAVSLNEQYVSSLAGSHTAKTSRSNAIKCPMRRNPNTKVLVSRQTNQYKHIKTFEELKSLLSADGDGSRGVEATKSQSSKFEYHNRVYYRTTDALPYTHAYDFDNDSEGEHDSEWQRAYTHRQINEFSDVNEGEKAMLKLWNLFVMKHNICGDCRIPFACEAFIDVHSQDIWHMKLYRNFLLHLCNLHDFGLLTSSQFHAIVQKLHATNRLHSTASTGAPA